MPRKHCHSRVRNRRQHVRRPETTMVRLYAYKQADGVSWREWEFRTVSQRHAKALLEAGDVYEVTREVEDEVQVVGYRATKPIRRTEQSPCSLTCRTTEAVAEWGLRLSRQRRGLSVEPLALGQVREVERFLMFPLASGARAPMAGIRVDREHRKLAQATLLAGCLPQIQAVTA